jgi:hypothetical protein
MGRYWGHAFDGFEGGFAVHEEDFIGRRGGVDGKGDGGVCGEGPGLGGSGAGDHYDAPTDVGEPDGYDFGAAVVDVCEAREVRGFEEGGDDGVVRGEAGHKEIMTGEG